LAARQHNKLLKESGISPVNITTNINIKERIATLAWANSIDPATWSPILSGPLTVNLRTLYTIPPALADATSGVSNLNRLAHMVALFMLDAVLPATSATHQANNAATTSLHPANIAASSSGINTRKGGDSVNVIIITVETANFITGKEQNAFVSTRSIEDLENTVICDGGAEP
jgi:hypothetical protein